MSNPTIIDIISPIMAGPSSSHTAGAVRLGLLARNVYNSNFNKVVFKLYNSYAQTGKGHGTDKGLLAGVLGFSVDDIRIKNVFDTPEAKGIKYVFEFLEDFNRHPNAVDIIFDGDLHLEISGNSVGAGEIEITGINDYQIKIDGKYNTFLLIYGDEPGVISHVTKIIQENEVNIAFLHCCRNSSGEDASMTVCLDGELSNDQLKRIGKLNNMYIIRYIKKLES